MYGKENFKIEVLGWAESKEELDQKEIWWIELFDAVNSDVFYNILIEGIIMLCLFNTIPPT